MCEARIYRTSSTLHRGDARRVSNSLASRSEMCNAVPYSGQSMELQFATFPFRYRAERTLNNNIGIIKLSIFCEPILHLNLCRAPRTRPLMQSRQPNHRPVIQSLARRSRTSSYPKTMCSSTIGTPAIRWLIVRRCKDMFATAQRRSRRTAVALRMGRDPSLRTGAIWIVLDKA